MKMERDSRMAEEKREEMDYKTVKGILYCNRNALFDIMVGEGKEEPPKWGEPLHAELGVGARTLPAGDCPKGTAFTK